MSFHESLSRRAMLLGLSAGTLQALQHAHTQVQSGSRVFSYLEPAAAADLEALASAIIPSDETPGAKEAGVIFFVDRALATFDQNRRGLYHEGTGGDTAEAPRDVSASGVHRRTVAGPMHGAGQID